MSEPHRIIFTTGASTVVDVPNTGQSREEATEQACSEVYVSLCHQCAKEVELGDFEPYEEEETSPDGDTGTRAVVESAPATPKLEMVEGGLYRNDVGAELRAVRPLLGQLGRYDVLVPDVWVFESHHKVLGTTECLATAEGLAACGYTLVAEETTDAQ